jgi:hypothetical protein
MCRRCRGERQFLRSIEETALYCSKQPYGIEPLLVALLMEETDQDVAKHLTFLYLDLEDQDEAVEETLIGRVYLSVLEMKAHLQ